MEIDEASSGRAAPHEGVAPHWGRFALSGLLSLVASGCAAVGCRGAGEDRVPVQPEGAQLAEVLDAMRVESHWIAGHRVNWRTGDPDERGTVPQEGYHSHCSAFVAAVATKLGVEILRPPEHSAVLLANAQCAWLEDEGRTLGWESVAAPLQAQQLANRGMLVVACYAERDTLVPGHIAIVRPEALVRRRIETAGPQVTQAGIENFRSTTLAEGFRHHPGAWSRRAVRFYAHVVLR